MFCQIAKRDWTGAVVDRSRLLTRDWSTGLHERLVEIRAVAVLGWERGTKVLYGLFLAPGIFLVLDERSFFVQEINCEHCWAASVQDLSLDLSSSPTLSPSSSTKRTSITWSQPQVFRHDYTSHVHTSYRMRIELSMVFSLVALPLHSLLCHLPSEKCANSLFYNIFSGALFSFIIEPSVCPSTINVRQKWNMIYVYGQRVKRFDTHTITWIYSLQCTYVHEPKLQLVLWWSYGIDRTSARARRGEAERDFNLHRMGIHPADHLDAWTCIYLSMYLKICKFSARTQLHRIHIIYIYTDQEKNYLEKEDPGLCIRWTTNLGQENGSKKYITRSDGN